MYSQKCAGDCPVCSDELYIFKTKSHKRLVKCVNEECPKNIIYGLPKAGTIEVTGVICPKNEFPILAIIPNLKLANKKYKSQTKRTYFWINGQPCFSCSKQDRCEALKEVKEDYFE